MNQGLHRVIFNAARGLRMVVAETASSTGKGGNAATDGRESAGWRSALFAIGWSALAAISLVGGTTEAHAQIVPNPFAAAGQKPQVLVAPNGVPLVNITTPSAAGVSINQYNQFDVNAAGAILNNSRTTASTQLGGLVQGNPWLATGPARIIVNQVTSSNPSYLNGYIEVAGQRAEVIIANPSGINVNGGGFINTSRATLTTGTPQYGAMGTLDSFLVQGGTVTINGNGLDLSTTDYAAILSRALQVNAAIYASELKVVTGANQVSADHAQVTPTAGTGAAPTFALDVSALGGMYAKKITLIGTEAGLGVRNAGSIGASAGNLVVTAAGRLENTGTLEGQSVQLSSTGSDIDNRGGTIRQTSTASLAIAAPTLSNTNGGWIGTEPLSVGTGAGTGTTSSTGGTGTTPTGTTGTTGSTGTGSGSGSGSTGTTTAAAPATPPDPGSITAAGAILNDGGKIYAGGPITLQSPNIVNAGGTLSVANMALNQQSFSNHGGTLNVSGNFSANVGSFDNSTGTVRAGNLNIATTGDLINVDGTLTSDSTATLNVGGKVDNTRGTIAATNTLAANVAGATDNTAGTLAANQGVQLATASLTNDKGAVQASAGPVQLTVTGALNNGQGSIGAGTDLTIQAGSLANASGGGLRATHDVQVTASGALTNAGSITAGRNTTLSAGSVQSTTGSVLGAGIQADGSLASTGDLHVAAANASAANGTNLAAGNASLQGASVDVGSGATSAANIALTATSGNVTTSGAKVVTPGTLSITAKSNASQALINDGGDLRGQSVSIDVSNLRNKGEILHTDADSAANVRVSNQLDNSGGHILSSGGAVISAGQAVQNTAGVITANAALSLSTGAVDNTDGTIASVASRLDLSVDANLTNLRGSIEAKDAVHLQAAYLGNGGNIVADNISIQAGALDNSGGAIAATSSIAIGGGDVTNTAGLIQSGGDLRLDLQAGTLRNSQSDKYSSGSGGLIAGQTLSIRAGDVSNQDEGYIGSSGTLSINASGHVFNTASSEMVSSKSIDLSAVAITNSASQIQALEGINLAAPTGLVENLGGLIRSNGDVAIQASNVRNSGSSGVADKGIEGRNLRVTAENVDNSQGALRADENLSLVASARVDNTGGIASAGKVLEITDPASGTATPLGLAVINAGGTLIAGEQLRLSVKSTTWDGSILSGGDLSLSQQDDIHIAAGSQTIANGSLSVATQGTLTNEGRLAAGNALTVTAADVDNRVSGELSSQNTTINASGTLTNRGVIDGSVTRINAGTLTNIGTGRIYGDQLAISASTLNNVAETVNGATSAATIAARQRLDLGVGTLNNRDGALIFSVGDIAIGGSLGADGRATGTASVVNNHAATIEALGNVNIAATTLNNTNGGVTWTIQPGATRNVVEYAVAGSADRLAPDQVRYVVNYFEPGVPGPRFMTYSAATPMFAGGQASTQLLVPSANYPMSRFAYYYDNPPHRSQDVYATTCSSPDQCTTEMLPGSWYAASDPVWAAFGVTAPPVLAPDHPGLQYGGITVGMTGYSTTDGNGVATTHDFAHPVTQAEYDQWQAYTTAHAQLDVALNDFAMDVRQHSYSAWNTWSYTEQQNTPVLQTSNPARIVAGGSMTLDVASGRNDMSQILAGGTLTVRGGTITNEQLFVDAPMTRTGLTGQTFVVGDDRMFNIGQINDTIPYTVALVGARQEGNLNPSITPPPLTGVSPGNTSQTPASAGTASGSAGAGQSPGGSDTTAPTVHPIVQVRLASSAGPDAVVRSTTPSLQIPTASLFRTNAGAGRYLIETDPRFAGYRNWLSSDYLLNNLGIDPNTAGKRLGDGFYEQQLIRDQVAQLTGQRYLDGFNSDEAQYQALMNAGMTFAARYGLKPGIALTEAQMAQLTSDIVWLVEETVTLSDGSVQKVLVPRLYVVAREGDIDGTGALLAGDKVRLQLQGGLVNQGTIAGRNAVAITADTVQNLNGRISANNVGIATRGDLDNIGGTIDGRDTVVLDVGGNLNVASTTRSTSGGQIGATVNSGNGLGLGVRTYSETVVDRVAGIYVSNPGGVLMASAGGDINLAGAAIVNSGKGGLTYLEAGGDINVGTVTTSKSELNLWGSGNLRFDSSSKEVGSVVQSAGNLQLSAGHDLTVRASSVQSTTGDTALTAGRNVTIEAGRNTSSVGQMLHGTDSSTFESTTTTGIAMNDNNLSVASSVGGKTVTILAGDSIVVSGSNVVSDKGTTLAATNNVTIQADSDTRHRDARRADSSSGEVDSDAGWTFGQQQFSASKQSTSVTAAPSTVGSITGDTTILAGGSYRQVGSDVIAPGGDISILARDVSITEARETHQSKSSQYSSQSGLTIGGSSPFLNQAMGALGTMSDAEDGKGDRLTSLNAANAALQGYGTAGDIARTSSTQQGGGSLSGKVTITVGETSSESHSSEQSNTARGSTLTAGGDINIVAVGAGANSNILIQGSTVAAGRDVNLAADNRIDLVAAANTSSSQSSSSSSGWSAGVGFAMGSQNGMTFEFNAGSSKGSSVGQDVSYTNTKVLAGNTVNMVSGGDTNLIGAIVQGGKQVNAAVGGNLTIQSLQDTSFNSTQQSSAGASASICVYPFCYGQSSASVSASKSSANGIYASVGEGSGIFAGDGGFNVAVGGTTTLVGGAIASTQAAVEGGKNKFSSNGLSMTDILNIDSQSGSAWGLSAGYQSSTDQNGTTTSQGPSGNSVGLGRVDTTRLGITTSGISGIAGDTAVRTGAGTTGTLANTWNGDQLLGNLGDQVAATAQFGQSASAAWGAYANQREREARAEAEQAQGQQRQNLLDEANRWAEGGAYRASGHAVIGAITGGAGGALGAATAAGLAEQINALTADLPPVVANGVGAALAMGIGAATGGAAGAAAAFNEDTNNRQLNYAERERIRAQANGDEEARRRLTRAACYVTQCWSQYPDGSALYNLNYVSYLEASSMPAELAWVGQQQQASGLFGYSGFQSATDAVAAMTGMSSGTFRGELITDPAAYAPGAAAIIVVGPLAITPQGQAVLTSNGGAALAGAGFNLGGQIFMAGGDIRQVNLGEAGIGLVTGYFGGAATGAIYNSMGAGWGAGLGGTGYGAWAGLGATAAINGGGEAAKPIVGATPNWNSAVGGTLAGYGAGWLTRGYMSLGAWIAGGVQETVGRVIESTQGK